MGELSLAEELALDTGKASQCRLCQYLLTTDDTARGEWARALNSALYTHSQLSRALGRRGQKISEDSVRNHRNKHNG
jgi:hypothetical protein